MMESWLGAPKTATVVGGGGVCVFTSVSVCACVRVCMRDVFTIYDNYILPRLIMTIIKIIILQTRHTDDFP